MNNQLYMRKLLMGHILCIITEPDAVEYMRKDIGKEFFNDGLSYVGLRLAWSENEDYFYAALDENQLINTDLKLARKNIQDMINQTYPFLLFMKLVSEANNEDQMPDIGHTFYFGQALASIERDDILVARLNKLVTLPLFRNGANKPSLSEKWRVVVDVMKEEGFLVANGDEALNTFTGKVSYQVDVIQRVLELQGVDLVIDEDHQEVLFS